MNHRIGLQPFGIFIGACLIALCFFAPIEFWISWKPGLIAFGIYAAFVTIIRLGPIVKYQIDIWIEDKRIEKRT